MRRTRPFFPRRPTGIGATALAAIVSVGCPTFNDTDCSFRRDHCPVGSSCDLRTGVCVEIVVERPSPTDTEDRDAGEVVEAVRDAGKDGGPLDAASNASSHGSVE